MVLDWLFSLLCECLCDCLLGLGRRRSERGGGEPGMAAARDPRYMAEKGERPFPPAEPQFNGVCSCVVRSRSLSVETARFLWPPFPSLYGLRVIFLRVARRAAVRWMFRRCSCTVGSWRRSFSALYGCAPCNWLVLLHTTVAGMPAPVSGDLHA